MEIGLILAVLAAVCLALGTIFARRGMAYTRESFSVLVITLSVNIIIFSLAVTYTAEWNKIWSLSWRGLAFLGAAGILQAVVGRFLYMTSIRLIGANKAGAITKTNILYAVILGITVLSESLTIPFVLGILGIITGVTLVSTEKKGVAEGIKASSSRIRMKGILAGLGTGLCRALSVVLIKLGIAEIGSPWAAAFVSYAIAFLIIASLLLRREQRRPLSQLSHASLIPYVIAGVVFSIGHLLRYTAVSYSPVSLVTPIMGTEIIFVLLFSFSINRNLEVFTWRIIIGVVAVVAGVILLST